MSKYYFVPLLLKIHFKLLNSYARNICEKSEINMFHTTNTLKTLIEHQKSSVNDLILFLPFFSILRYKSLIKNSNYGLHMLLEHRNYRYTK